ncbi:MAG: 2-dehydropantoate 2-reductase [Alphaproteobacteria bacterium]|nr:2-dehydropantoate 2-reductase [Alphaproteobacteria bacterium]
MRILVLGAGAVGGYFGGRMVEGGADVTFLVRERRRAALARDGLVVKSVLGDLKLAVKTLTAGETASPFDFVLLSCKAYDLASAMNAIAPVMGPDGAVLPLLNGIAHLEALTARFGVQRVLGGCCYIGATLDPDGAVRHMGRMQSLLFGEIGDRNSARVTALAAVLARTKIDAEASPAILQAMWDKFVMLAALAASTTLTRATVGEIMAAPSGEAFMLAVLTECAAVAKAEGFSPSPAAYDGARRTLTQRGSGFAASMMRDMLKGGRTEGDHVIGDLVRRGAARQVATPMLRAALVNLETHEAKRAATAADATQAPAG